MQLKKGQKRDNAVADAKYVVIKGKRWDGDHKNIRLKNEPNRDSHGRIETKRYRL